MCDEIGLVSVVNAATQGDAARCKLSPGELIRAFLIACFLRQRPLYRLFVA